MKRYTYFDGGKWRLKIGDTEYSGDWVDRLAAYEDTGLEPEEIRDSIGGISPICVQCNGKTSDGIVTEKCGYPDDITKCLEQSKHLCELAQAEKEGRIVVLPCKVGDTVYRVGASICKWREIDHCDEYCDGWQYRDCWEGTRAVLEEKFSLCDLESIGKTVFLTREAAEAALEEMEADHDR